MFDLSTLLSASNPKDALTRANFAVQDKLGKFMSLGNRVINLRDRAKNAPQVETANTILEGIAATQARALSVLGEAKALQDSMTNNVSISAAKSAVAVGQDLLSINAEMDALTSKADAFAAQVGDAPATKTGTFLEGVDPRFVLLGVGAAIMALLYLTRKSRRRGKR